MTQANNPANTMNLESFIPFRRGDLVKLCLEDGFLRGDNVRLFKEFCEILQAYLHFKQHYVLEDLKDRYAQFNPDAVTIPLDSEMKEPLVASQEVANSFDQLLKNANFSPLKDELLAETLAEVSLIPLKTSVDFNDYQQIIIYYRGERIEQRSKRHWLKKKTINLKFFDRVAVLLHFKDNNHFKKQREKQQDLPFKPGAMYLYFYKDIPSMDLDLLFPTVKVSMNWFDRLMFGIPAIGAAVPIITKALPSLGLVISAILVLIFGVQTARDMGFSLDQVDSLWPILTAVLSLGIGIGGFAFKQYLNYKNKRLKFLKKVTDTLFFSQLVANAGVLYTLVDAAEEEIGKEMMLVFYHLLKAEQAMNKEQLDQQIEQWLADKINSLRPQANTDISRLSKVDFDIEKALKHLSELQGPLAADDTNISALVNDDGNGYYQAISLEQARYMIDSIWDNYFAYAN